MPKAKNTQNKTTNQKKPVSDKNVTLLGILGILGLIFIISGVIAVFAVSLFLGVTLIVVGIISYVLFVFIEKKLKLI